MADNTLSGLIVTIYDALDTVSREQIGFIPAVRKWSFPGKKVAQNEPITYPVVPSFSAPTAISASNIIADPSGITVGKGTMYMDNCNVISWGWNGEEATGLGNSGIFATSQADAFKQAFRAHANQIEAALAGLYLYSSRACGSASAIPFATVNDLSDLGNLRQILEDNGQWFEGRMHVVLSTKAMNKLRSIQTTIFKANEAGTRDMQLTGTVAQLEGWNLHVSGFIKTHQNGTNGMTSPASYLVSSGAKAVGLTSIPLITGTGTILAGDVVDFSTTDTDNYYVVGTGITAAGSAVLNAPGLVKALAGGETVITQGNSAGAAGTYQANMGFQQDALVLVSALPNLPPGGDQAVARTTVVDPVSGLNFEISEYKGYRKTIYAVAAAWGVASVKSEGSAILMSK